MPWNSGGPQGPGPGPWGRPGPLGGGPPLPELDEMLARAQAWFRRLVPGRPAGGRSLALIAAVLAALWLASGFYRVEPDEEGVVLRFGAFVRTTPPGLNYHLPWPVESVLRPAVTRINRIEVGYRVQPTESGADPGVLPPGRDLPARDVRAPPPRDVAEESLMLTGDENIVDINFAVFWRISDAGAFLFRTRNPGYTVKSAAESVMREVVGSTPIQPALTEARARIEQAVRSGTQAILDQYGAGVEVTQVQLQKVDPPDAVIDSFRDVQRANTDAERMRNEAEAYRNDIVPRARGEAARIVAEADGARQAAVAEASGQARRFLSVLQAYDAAKDVTLRRLYIETMQQVLSDAPSIVVDDRLRGLVPFLQLGGAPPPGPSAPDAPPPGPSAPGVPPPGGAP